MAEPDRRRAVPSELGVAALVIAASLPLGRLFRTGGIGAAAVAATATSLAIAWSMRRLRAPTILSATVSALAFFWFASVAFFREALLGPFPTPHSVSLIWSATVEAIRHSQTDVAPVVTSSAFLTLASFAVWATAWLADDAAIKLRHPMLAIGVTVPLYVLPGTILVGNHRWVDAGLYLAAALWVLFQDERSRLWRWGRVVGTGVPGWHPGLAVRMGAAAIALALAATPVLPGFGAPPGLRGATGSGVRSTPRPLVGIKPQLGERVPRELFWVRTRIPTYWRLTALDRFDGITWTSGPQRPELPLSGRSISTQNLASTIPVDQQIEIRTLGGPWLPAAYEAVRVDGLRGTAADPDTRAIISPRDLRSGLKYRVSSRIPQLTYQQLDQVPFTTDPAMRPYLEMPVGRSTRSIASVARGVVAAARRLNGSPFAMAVALQNYLRTFIYDEQVAQNLKITDVEDFLMRAKRGYCEQFATAMAAMARTLGLPARVVIGFAGGGPGRTPDEFVVSTRNAHAWVEIWFQGFGWISFEPTPRADSVVVPSYTSPAAFPTPEPAPTATPTSSSEPSPSPTSSARAGIDPEAAAGGRTGLARRLLTVGVAAGGLLILLAGVFPVASRVRRRVRRSRARSAAELVATRYLDFLDWCAATGNGRHTGETPLEHARRLAEASSDAGEMVTSLASFVVDAVYARPNGIDPSAVERLEREARAGIAAGLPRRTRWLALLGWRWWRMDPASRAPRQPRERTLTSV